MRVIQANVARKKNWLSTASRTQTAFPGSGGCVLVMASVRKARRIEITKFSMILLYKDFSNASRNKT